MIIVEDAPLIALDLAETMKDLGFDVRATAFTHDQALAEIQRLVPDYAVIDLHLGPKEDGRDGEALLSMLDARGCRILVFSGDEDACRRVAEHYPKVSVLSKPAQPEALAREINRLKQLPAA
jgi:ActR/RegA family two-component response regulator